MAGRFHAPAALAFTLVVLFSGCAPKSTKQPVSGTIIYNGLPLESGQVTFFRADGTPGAAGSSIVVKGHFEIPAINGNGLDPGTYIMKVSCPVPGGTRTPEQIEAGASAPAKESLPAKYNAESKLTIEVKAGEKNEFDFNLDDKK